MKNLFLTLKSQMLRLAQHDKGGKPYVQIILISLLDCKNIPIRTEKSKRKYVTNRLTFARIKRMDTEQGSSVAAVWRYLCEKNSVTGNCKS